MTDTHPSSASVRAHARLPLMIGATALLGAAALFSGAAWAEPTWYKPPVDISVEGHRIDELFLFTTIMLSFLFLGMTAIMVYSMLVYRERPGHKALYDHDRRPVQTVQDR